MNHLFIFEIFEDIGGLDVTLGTSATTEDRERFSIVNIDTFFWKIQTNP